MIKIINVGEVGNGKHKYEIYINSELITTYCHRRDRGLAECLRTAAQAIDMYDADRYVQLCFEEERKKNDREKVKEAEVHNSKTSDITYGRDD